MKRIWTALIVAGLVGGLAAFPGCAKQDETGGTSTDSTLSLGDFPPETSPAPESAYAPGSYEEPAPTQAPPPAASKPKPKPKPKPAAPAPEPEDPGVTVPAGTSIAVTFATEISTKDKVAGDGFTATLANPVIVNGQTIFPAGSPVNGHIVEAVRPGKSSGRGKLVLAYDSIDMGGKSYRINSVGAPIEGKSGTGGDAAKIGGGAAAGAILGKVIGGSGSDAAKGAVIGGAAGTAASLLTRGPDPKVTAGQTVTLTTDNAVTVKLPKV